MTEVRIQKSDVRDETVEKIKRLAASIISIRQALNS
jgi:hypothetical protein